MKMRMRCIIQGGNKTEICKVSQPRSQKYNLYNFCYRIS